MKIQVSHFLKRALVLGPKNVCFDSSDVEFILILQTRGGEACRVRRDFDRCGLCQKYFISGHNGSVFSVIDFSLQVMTCEI